MKATLKPTLSNESGIITIDFLFAFVLVMGFSAILFALTLTLTVAELTQYITFASARNYMAAHVTEDLQREMAFQKYQQLIDTDVAKPLFSNGWFEIDKEPLIGDVTQSLQGYRNSNVNLFYGTATQFIARMLDFHIPFYGSTTNDGDGSGDGFKTYIGSYLGREPTANECINFTTQRWSAIRRISVSGGSSYSTSTSDQNYAIITDNGC